VQVSLRVWEGGNCPELDSFSVTWDRTPVEKHKKKQKHNEEITGDFNPERDPYRALTVRESQQQEHGTQPVEGVRAAITQTLWDFST
jgi:hypothetical protein